MSGNRALILGVNGQDGSYLAEHLLALGWHVTGVARQQAITSLAGDPDYNHVEFDLAVGGSARRDMIETALPDVIFHVAAIHGAAGFSYEAVWQQAIQVNTAAVHDCLEYLRTSNRGARLAYTSSLKAFGAVPPAVINEDSPKYGSCLYSITKNAATDLIDVYRKSHDVRASSYFVFNHDSPRRPPQYFLPRLCAAVADAQAGEPPMRLNSLDFCCDWGSAREFMEIVAATIQLADNQDYVVASGKTWAAAELAATLFASYGMDWKNHLTLSIPAGSEPLRHYRADLNRLESVLGRKPESCALAVAHWIIKENHRLMPQ